MNRKTDVVFLSISVLAMAAVAIVCAIHICVVAHKYVECR